MELVDTDEALRKINPLEAERHKYVVRYEHAERTAKYEADLALACDDLSASKRQYSYLRQQAQLADAGGEEATCTCPVCHEEVGRERSVPKCAHSLCSPCAEQIMRRHAGKFVCPICREEGPPAMASELRWADGSSAGTHVQGSWGTKVTAIVEQAQSLPAGDKCLIFSQWDDMLSLIGRALGVNGVPFRRLHGAAKLEAALAGFRQDAEVRALLLPLKSGANGISLVEAQHVFLAEPLLEREVEAQAIGRVHRMSQTRPTIVHRFVMKDTIEEAIVGLRRATDAAAEPGADDAASGGGAPSPGSGGRGSGVGGVGSPSKRPRRSEESKMLSWETVQALGALGGFSSPASH